MAIGDCSAVMRTPQAGLTDKIECENGFWITGACLGIRGTPPCCQEELCGKLYWPIGGKPPTLAERK